MKRGQKLLKYQEEKKNSILNLKDSIEIVVMGPYEPQSELKRIRDLRDAMKKDGYTNTNLVEDYPDLASNGDSDVSAGDKSYLLIESADLLYFVFTCEGEKGGVSDELSYFSNNLSHRHDRGVVFDEISKGVLATSRLNRRHSKIRRIDYVKFDGNKKDEEDLHSLARAKAYEFLHRDYTLYRRF